MEQGDPAGEALGGADVDIVEDGDAEVGTLGEDMRHEMKHVEFHRPLVRERWREGHVQTKVMLLSGRNRSCAFDVEIVQLDESRESSVLCESL